MGQYRSSLSGTLQNLDTTGVYYNQLVNSIEPTASFMYNNLMTNDIFYGIIITILVISFINFGK